MALVTISVVMVVSLRSITAGLMPMAPNIVPIWFVFGFVGYIGMPVDIGMMMTGSIAIGISVDCTFHYLVKYLEEFRKGMSSGGGVLRRAGAYGQAVDGIDRRQQPRHAGALFESLHADVPLWLVDGGADARLPGR